MVGAMMVDEAPGVVRVGVIANAFETMPPTGVTSNSQYA